MHRLPKPTPHILRCVLAAFLFVSVSAFALDGPETLTPGRFATYTAETDGDWVVLPDCPDCYAKDSGGRALFLAIPESGVHSIVHFAVVGGQPKIEVKTVTVSSLEPTPEPAPEPTPKPTPEPVPGIPLTAAEKAAMKAAVEAVLASMDAGTTKTPQGARYLLKQSLLQKIGTCDMTGCRLPENVNKTLVAWETRMDITTLEGLKRGFSTVLEELRK